MTELLKRSCKIFDAHGLFCDPAKADVIESNFCRYDFNRATDALCFKNALSDFLNSGMKEKAFEVFFCYSEIFKTFGGYKDGIDVLLGLLYDHESRAATLLTNHRDHYSHSVYVFALGLAIFNSVAAFRTAFEKAYGKDDAETKFIKAWGMAALFHDVGYPYEITFMQLKRYGNLTDDAGVRLGFKNPSAFTALSPDDAAKLGKFLPDGCNDMIEFFAHVIADRFGSDKCAATRSVKKIVKCLRGRADGGEFVDHAYFSAVLLLKKLFKTPSFKLDGLTLDAVIAILMHNGFYNRAYKAEIAKSKFEKLKVSQSPLAYLLMLCDELQCWDRVAYGELSRMQQSPWDADLTLSGNKLEVRYYFENSDCGALDGVADFINASIVDTSEIVGELVTCGEIRQKDRKIFATFSDCRFVDLRKIAESINESYYDDARKSTDTDESLRLGMTEKFDKLTLEYKLSNIKQAENYIRHVDSIGCFFSDKLLDYENVTSFTREETEFLAVREHIRWSREKVQMGWKYGVPKDKADRENRRIHPDLVPYEDLSSGEKQKDLSPINRMVEKMAIYGIRVYRQSGVKPKLTIGCTGHIRLERICDYDEQAVRAAIRAKFLSLTQKYSVTLLSGFADGADTVFAEEALDCGVETVAVLPCEYPEFAKEHSDGGTRFMQLLAQTVRTVVCPAAAHRYVGVRDYIVNNCDELFVLWDGVRTPLADADGNPVNLGGTYDTMTAVRNAKKPITEF